MSYLFNSAAFARQARRRRTSTFQGGGSSNNNQRRSTRAVLESRYSGDHSHQSQETPQPSAGPNSTSSPAIDGKARSGGGGTAPHRMVRRPSRISEGGTSGYRGHTPVHHRSEHRSGRPHGISTTALADVLLHMHRQQKQQLQQITAVIGGQQQRLEQAVNTTQAQQQQLTTMVAQLAKQQLAQQQLIADSAVRATNPPQRRSQATDHTHPADSSPPHRQRSSSLDFSPLSPAAAGGIAVGGSRRRGRAAALRSHGARVNGRSRSGEAKDKQSHETSIEALLHQPLVARLMNPADHPMALYSSQDGTNQSAKAAAGLEGKAVAGSGAGLRWQRRNSLDNGEGVFARFQRFAALAVGPGANSQGGGTWVDDQPDGGREGETEVVDRNVPRPKSGRAPSDDGSEPAHATIRRPAGIPRTSSAASMSRQSSSTPVSRAEQEGLHRDGGAATPSDQMEELISRLRRASASFRRDPTPSAHTPDGGHDSSQWGVTPTALESAQTAPIQHEEGHTAESPAPLLQSSSAQPWSGIATSGRVTHAAPRLDLTGPSKLDPSGPVLLHPTPSHREAHAAPGGFGGRAQSTSATATTTALAHTQGADTMQIPPHGNMGEEAYSGGGHRASMSGTGSYIGGGSLVDLRMEGHRTYASGASGSGYDGGRRGSHSPADEEEEDGTKYWFPQGCDSWQHKVHLLLSEPSSSKVSRAIGFLIMVTITYSVVLFCVQSLEKYRIMEEEGDPLPVFFILEAIAIVIFTIEYLGRLLTVAYVPEDGDKAADGPGSTHNDRNAEMSSTRALAPPADHRDSAESAAGSRGHTKTVSDMPQDVNPIASLSSGRPDAGKARPSAEPSNDSTLARAPPPPRRGSSAGSAFDQLPGTPRRTSTASLMAVDRSESTVSQQMLQDTRARNGSWTARPPPPPPRTSTTTLTVVSATPSSSSSDSLTEENDKTAVQPQTKPKPATGPTLWARICACGRQQSRSAGKIWRFVKQPMNVIDLAAIVPFYIELLFAASGGGLAVLRVLRLARVFRVFKLGKYSHGMQMMARVIIASAQAMYLLGFFIALGAVLFGTAIFFAEAGSWDPSRGCYVRDAPGELPDGVYSKECSPFTSIPASFWWVLVTTTTLGYGDMVPTTPLGQVVAVIVMHAGILVLALPITVLGAHFAIEYDLGADLDAHEGSDAGSDMEDDGGGYYMGGSIEPGSAWPNAYLAKLSSGGHEGDSFHGGSFIIPPGHDPTVQGADLTYTPGSPQVPGMGPQPVSWRAQSARDQRGMAAARGPVASVGSTSGGKKRAISGAAMTNPILARKLTSQSLARDVSHSKQSGIPHSSSARSVLQMQHPHHQHPLHSGVATVAPGSAGPLTSPPFHHQHALSAQASTYTTMAGRTPTSAVPTTSAFPSYHQQPAHTDTEAYLNQTRGVRRIGTAETLGGASFMSGVDSVASWRSGVPNGSPPPPDSDPPLQQGGRRRSQPIESPLPVRTPSLPPRADRSRADSEETWRLAQYPGSSRDDGNTGENRALTPELPPVAFQMSKQQSITEGVRPAQPHGTAAAAAKGNDPSGAALSSIHEAVRPSDESTSDWHPAVSSPASASPQSSYDPASPVKDDTSVSGTGTPRFISVSATAPQSQSQATPNVATSFSPPRPPRRIGTSNSVSGGRRSSSKSFGANVSPRSVRSLDTRRHSREALMHRLSRDGTGAQCGDRPPPLSVAVDLPTHDPSHTEALMQSFGAPAVESIPVPITMYSNGASDSDMMSEDGDGQGLQFLRSPRTSDGTEGSMDSEMRPMTVGIPIKGVKPARPRPAVEPALSPKGVREADGVRSARLEALENQVRELTGLLRGALTTPMGSATTPGTDMATPHTQAGAITPGAVSIDQTDLGTMRGFGSTGSMVDGFSPMAQALLARIRSEQSMMTDRTDASRHSQPPGGNQLRYSASTARSGAEGDGRRHSAQGTPNMYPGGMVDTPQSYMNEDLTPRALLTRQKEEINHVSRDIALALSAFIVQPPSQPSSSTAPPGGNMSVSDRMAYVQAVIHATIERTVFGPSEMYSTGGIGRPDDAFTPIHHPSLGKSVSVPPVRDMNRRSSGSGVPGGIKLVSNPALSTTMAKPFGDQAVGPIDQADLTVPTQRGKASMVAPTGRSARPRPEMRLSLPTDAEVSRQPPVSLPLPGRARLLRKAISDSAAIRSSASRAASAETADQTETTAPRAPTDQDLRLDSSSEACNSTDHGAASVPAQTSPRHSEHDGEQGAV